MKANEIKDGKILMIGDLIIGCIETDIVNEATYKILCKVTGISHYGDVSCEALKSFPDELDWQDGDDFSWIEAIPLTAEILEKNGFKEYNGLYRLDIAEGVFVNADFNSKEPFVSVHNTCYRATPICRYLHQLQHALRLCGTSKEFVL